MLICKEVISPMRKNTAEEGPQRDSLQVEWWGQSMSPWNSNTKERRVWVTWTLWGRESGRGKSKYGGSEQEEYPECVRSVRGPLEGCGWREDRLRHWWGPVQHQNIGHLVSKSWRILKIATPLSHAPLSPGPCVTAHVTHPWSWLGAGHKVGSQR